MKLLHKVSVRIVIALVVGFLLAGALTKITYTCTPIDDSVNCVAFDKAIMHPADLLNNKQNSLVKFSLIFAISAVTIFAILTVITKYHARGIK
ncbi:TPA: hypothetical protein DIV49_02305 [Candidatus Saccharibacteria bacterium]|nr:hypothetical protein [Candidatus Saccharibacteria bacterium]